MTWFSFINAVLLRLQTLQRHDVWMRCNRIERENGEIERGLMIKLLSLVQSHFESEKKHTQLYQTRISAQVANEQVMHYQHWDKHIPWKLVLKRFAIFSFAHRSLDLWHFLHFSLHLPMEMDGFFWILTKKKFISLQWLKIDSKNRRNQRLKWGEWSLIPKRKKCNIVMCVCVFWWHSTITISSLKIRVYAHFFRRLPSSQRCVIFIAIDTIERPLHCIEIFWRFCIVGIFGDLKFSCCVRSTHKITTTVLEAKDENKQRSAYHEDFRYVTGSVLTLPHRINNNNKYCHTNTHTERREKE